MTEIFLGQTGYYITGAHESIFKCSAPEDVEDSVFLYQLLYGALCEIRGVDDQITIYNDSRLIEELNGIVKPLSETSQKWLLFIRRNVLPRTAGRIFFRKKSTEFILNGQQQCKFRDKPEIPTDSLINRIFRKSKKRTSAERFKSRWTRTSDN